ncbi:putative Prefoldin subunit [Leishmania shawi]|uniref:Prefoldin subunit n=1 Tax=Leishmania shawi TaxID=5680 RepID=A0AAW3BFR6_9TRYP
MCAEEYGEGEVLTGAELYLYLLHQNEEQLRRAQEKLREYATLKDTLHVLTERSRRRVLAPVAGGLAYYPAELNATNTILVLLGDGWFAERSAVQAAEIAGRRIDFLRRETEVLQQEQNALRAKQELFLSELPEAQDAVAELLAKKETRAAAAPSLSQPSPLSETPQQQSQAAASSSESVASANAPDRFETPDAVCAPASNHLASFESCLTPLPSSTPPTSTASPLASGLPLDYSIDVALTTFDELDELTEDELIALEAELGDHVNDDDYVERIMTERMIAKKERRIRTELQRRSSAAAEIDERSKATEGAPVPTSPPTSAPAAAPIATTALQLHGAARATVTSTSDNSRLSTGRGEAIVYQTPGDIGWTMVQSLAKPSAGTDTLPTVQSAASLSPNEIINGCAPTSSPSATVLTSARPLVTATLTEADVLPEASPSVSAAAPSPRKEKHVRFAADVGYVGGLSMAAAVAAVKQPQVTTSGELGSCNEFISSETGPGYPPSLLRSTYTIGDIVERKQGTVGCDGGALAGVAAGSDVESTLPLPPFLPGQLWKSKRKSLFMRELEGDGA